MAKEAYLESIRSTNDCIQVFYYDHDGRTRILDGAITIDKTIRVLNLFKHQWEERLEVEGNEIHMYNVSHTNYRVNTYNCWSPETVNFILKGIDALERVDIKKVLETIPPSHLAEADVTKMFHFLRSQLFPKMTFKQFLQVWMEGE